MAPLARGVCSWLDRPSTLRTTSLIVLSLAACGDDSGAGDAASTSTTSQAGTASVSSTAATATTNADSSGDGSGLDTTSADTTTDAVDSSSDGTTPGCTGDPPAWVSSLPVRQWSQVPNTDFSVSDARMTFSDGERSHRGAVGGWAGWVRDPATGVVYQTGGGHSDGADNSVYALSTADDVMTWSRAVDGTYDVDDRVEFVTIDAENYLSNWNADGKPTASHVYHGMHVVQGKIFWNSFYQNYGDTRPPMEFAPNNEPWMIGFDIAAGAFPPPGTYTTPPNYTPGTFNTGGWARRPSGSDGNELFLVDYSVAAGGVFLNAFDPSTNAWRTVGPEMAHDAKDFGLGGKCTDLSRSMIVNKPEQDENLYLYSWTEGGRSIVSLTGPNADFAMKWDSSYMGVAHDTLRDVYYCYSGRESHDTNVYRIDPNNRYYTDILEVRGRGHSDATSINSRFIYLPEYDTIIMHPSYTSGVWALSLGCG